ncbi:lanthionine synthetase C family protein [Hymenobacter terrestris]|uniref:Lanthionine synthetase C family protein n=1 Tax=Hymenobacter terrestris TaxID=2748310 RepID=A0ABX2Q842_9BACT|nr:lanthionine synthetase C family protein [Hymenobacter terrestris]NVO85874.1 lanthionine synthetase C family protein [Hymenobacter terrestris]
MVSVKTVESAIDKIQQIEQALFANYQTELAAGEVQVSLMNGASGLALFYYELYDYSQDEQYRHKAISIINQVLQQLQEHVGSFTYCNGLAGPAYLFNYLREKGFLGSSIDELLLDADHVLVALMQRLLKQANLDLLHGALGMGHYLLARLALDPERAQLLNACEALVDGIAQQLEAGLAFNEFVPGYTNEKARYVNCGMAHGVVANLMFLVKYLPLAARPERVRALLQSTQQLLRRYRSADDTTLSAYPSIVMIKEHGIETYYGIPLGWCYGDTTVSVGLYHAGRALGDEALVAEAQALAERATRRSTPATALTYDAGFCHGSSNVAHTYRKWLEYSGDESFRHHYHTWIAQTLALGHHAEGPGGYQKFAGEGHEVKYGLLDGVIGVALVLLDSLRPGAPSDWDRFFLLS